MRMRRQLASEFDVPTIEKLAVRADRDKHRRVRVFRHADRREVWRGDCRSVFQPSVTNPVTKSEDRPEGSANENAIVFLFPFR